MNELRKAAEMALEALRNAEVVHMEQLNAMYALQEALAQPDLANVGEVGVWGHKREWVGLTDEEKYDVLEGATGDGGHVYYDTLFRTIEAKLKENMTDLSKALAQPEQESVCAHGVEKTKCGFCKQPEQKPVAWMVEGSLYASKEVAQKMGGNAYTLQALYTAPPKREWVGLSDEEGAEIWADAHDIDRNRLVTPKEIVRRIEAKLKEKNT